MKPLIGILGLVLVNLAQTGLILWQSSQIKALKQPIRLEAEWFGAKADGVTDCSVVLQGAFNVMSHLPHGGTLVFGGGIYNLGDHTKSNAPSVQIATNMAWQFDN